MAPIATAGYEDMHIIRIEVALALGAALLSFHAISADIAQDVTYICRNLDASIARPTYVIIDSQNKVFTHIFPFSLYGTSGTCTITYKDGVVGPLFSGSTADICAKFAGQDRNDSYLQGVKISSHLAIASKFIRMNPPDVETEALDFRIGLLQSTGGFQAQCHRVSHI